MALWSKLIEHHKKISCLHSRDFLEESGTRFHDFSLHFKDLIIDYSKNHITKETVKLLIKLAKERDVETYIEAMFAGENINTTENRPALHVALRGSGPEAIKTEVKKAAIKVNSFTNKVLSGQWRGAHGDKISEIVNIGIGGSHLGPEMAIRALRPFHKSSIRVHFVSNIDGHDLSETLSKVSPRKTLFIVASKTFTTQETMLNAESARLWLIAHLGEEAVSKHFVAITANSRDAESFGIIPDLVFPMWDWVGGRFSIWSPIGLSVALQIGVENFKQLIMGGFEMDEHFRYTPLIKNLPVMLALVGVWNRNFENLPALAILPYDHRLLRFPAFIQQLDMESNGKTTNKNGIHIDKVTGPIVFGETGTNSQHSFFQALHQGSNPIPSDFILVANPAHSLKTHHEVLLANAVAQTRALMLGRSENNVNAGSFRTCTGSRPTNTILIKTLDPKTLGSLIALYEHKIFIQGLIWDINSFDQWGVQLGKEMTKEILSAIKYPKSSLKLDSSTINLMQIIKDWQS